jgi:hypothetical protein
MSSLCFSNKAFFYFIFFFYRRRFYLYNLPFNETDAGLRLDRYIGSIQCHVRIQKNYLLLNLTLTGNDLQYSQMQ